MKKQQIVGLLHLSEFITAVVVNEAVAIAHLWTLPRQQQYLRFHYLDVSLM